GKVTNQANKQPNKQPKTNNSNTVKTHQEQKLHIPEHSSKYEEKPPKLDQPKDNANKNSS
ncbi:hypothetical protein GBA52_016802, partial [Prunus armeniaca]